MTLDYMSDFTYYNNLPTHLFHQGTILYEKVVDSKIYVAADQTEIIIDNSLEDSKIKIEASYYKDYVTIDQEQYEEEGVTYIYFHVDYVKNSFNWKRDVRDLLVKQLEKKEIYNYSLLNDVMVKIYVNENTRKWIQ